MSNTTWKKKTKKRVRLPGTNYNRQCTISQVEVRCPNVILGGTSKYGASPGDLLLWSYTYPNDERRFGRVIGRVDAPACNKDIPAVEGHIAVLEMSIWLGAGYIRWVDPKMVFEVRDVPKKFIEWFFSDAPTTMDIEQLHRAERYGSLSEHHIDDLPNRFCTKCHDFMGASNTCRTEGCPNNRSGVGKAP